MITIENLEASYPPLKVLHGIDMNIVREAFNEIKIHNS